jgi:TonB family protein
MKKCPTCGDEYSDKFKFCPVDSSLLSDGGDVLDTVTLNSAPRELGGDDADVTAPVMAAAIPASVPADGNGARAVNTAIAGDDDATHAGAAAGDGHATSDVADNGFAANVASPREREEFHLTFVSEEGLTRRLLREVGEVGRESQLTWPEFKRDPWGFTKRGAQAYGSATWKKVQQPNVAAGVMAAFVVLILGGSLLAAGANWARLKCDYLMPLFRRQCSQQELAQVREDLELQNMLTQDVPEEQKKPDKGPAGTAKGTGGGSKPQYEKPHGGGGGGRQETKPASFGKLPPASMDVPQVVAPDPHPPTVKNPHLPTPASIDADPVLFPPDPRNLPYGDLKSKSTDPSSGPGTGNGIGTGTGGGVGSGEGGGVGPGRGGNTGGGDRSGGGGGPGGGGGGDYDRVFNQKEVTRKATVIDKPEPLYTEEARKNQITGTVTVRMVLNANGSVTGIVPVSRLPDGLTEKAIEAARKIKFVPAEKDGHKVSQYATIQYNFNIY